MSFSLLRSQHPLISASLDTLFPLACCICRGTITKDSNEGNKRVYQDYKFSGKNSTYKKYKALKEVLWKRLLCKCCQQALLESMISYINKAHCACCGRPCRTSHKAPLCLTCLQHRTNKNLRIRSLFFYHQSARLLIRMAKYHQKQELANLLSLLVVSKIHSMFLPGSAYYSSDAAELSWESVCYVPSYSNNIMNRGFYSTHYISKTIAGALKTPFQAIYLKTEGINKTPRSHIPRERKFTEESPEYLCGFKNSENKKFTKVLLIDDVITTGSSISAAIKALSQAGVEKIDVLSIAQSKRLHRYLFR